MVKERVVLVVHALVGWAVCGMTVALGLEVLSMQSTLVLHAVVAPLAFWLLAWRYAVWFPKGSPVEVSAPFSSSATNPGLGPISQRH